MSLSSASSKYFDTEEDQELLACAQVIALADGGHDFGVATWLHSIKTKVHP